MGWWTHASLHVNDAHHRIPNEMTYPIYVCNVYLCMCMYILYVFTRYEHVYVDTNVYAPLLGLHFGCCPSSHQQKAPAGNTWENQLPLKGALVPSSEIDSLENQPGQQKSCQGCGKWNPLLWYNEKG